MPLAGMVIRGSGGGESCTERIVQQRPASGSTKAVGGEGRGFAPRGRSDHGAAEDQQASDQEGRAREFGEEDRTCHGCPKDGLSKGVGIRYLCGKQDSRVFYLEYQAEHVALGHTLILARLCFSDPIRTAITSETGMNAPKRSFSHVAFGKPPA